MSHLYFSVTHTTQDRLVQSFSITMVIST